MSRKSDFVQSIIKHIVTAIVTAALAGAASYLKGWMAGETERKELDEALSFAIEYYSKP